MVRKTPVEDLVDAKEAAAKVRKQHELDQLTQWKQTGNPAHLAPLLEAFQPILANATRKYKAPTIPEAAFQAQLTTHLIQAFETFDPTRGAALNTHVENRLRKVHRYNNRHQNFSYIPPEPASFIGPIDRAQAELQDELGRAPTHSEIAGHLGIKERLVNRVQTARRADIPSSAFEDDPFEKSIGRNDEVLSLLPYSLNEKQREVFQYLYGDKKHLIPRKGGKVNMGQLATMLGMSGSQLSRIHASIGDAFKKYK